MSVEDEEEGMEEGREGKLRTCLGGKAKRKKKTESMTRGCHPIFGESHKYIVAGKACGHTFTLVVAPRLLITLLRSTTGRISGFIIFKLIWSTRLLRSLCLRSIIRQAALL